MRTLSPAITAEKNKTAGARPLWILKLPRQGTTDLYVSDRVVTFTAADATQQTTKAWVASWGPIKEGITNGLGELSIADFNVHLLSDPADTANIIYQIDTYDLETGSAELQLWFEGVTDGTPAVKLFAGHIKEIHLDDNDAGAELRLQDATLKLQGTVGTVLDSATYPLADPDHIGKLLPIVYGSVAKLPALCVDAGWVTSLANQTLSTDTTVTVSELPSASVVGKTFYIDAEQITVTAANTTTRVLTVTRGANSTNIVNHAMGAVVIEKKATPIVFLLADHALDTIGDIYIRVAGVDVNITTSVTKYLGTTANQLPAYPGKAAITIATTPAVMQQIWLAIENALNIDQGNHAHPTSTSVSTVTFNTHTLLHGTFNNITNMYDGSFSTYAEGATSSGDTVRLIRSTSVSGGTPLNIRLAINYSVTGPSIVVRIYVLGILKTTWVLPAQSSQATQYSGWFPISSWLDIYSYGNTYVEIDVGAVIDRIYEVYWEVQTGTATTYSPASGVALTGDLSLIGNSIANVYTMDQLMGNVSRTTVATPLLAINDILTRAGYPAATGSSTITSAINGAITDQRSTLTWLARLAFESWALFKLSAAGSLLIPRGVGSPQKTITTAMLRRFSRKKTSYEDIINKIDLRFELDYSNASRDPYRQTTSAEDVTSQAIYGTHDRPDLFALQFITSSDTAEALCDNYLAWYAVRHWFYEVEVFLDNVEIEYGDTVTLGFLNPAKIGVVREARVTPGDESEPDTITLVVEV